MLVVCHLAFSVVNQSQSYVLWLTSCMRCVLCSVFKPGFRVVDPMCGVGTILIEAAQEHKVRKEIMYCGSLKCRNV